MTENLSKRAIQLSSRSTGADLTVDPDNMLIVFNGKFYRVPRETVIETIWIICSAHPNVCTYDQLKDHLVSRNQMMGNSDDDAKLSQKAVSYVQEFSKKKLKTAPQLFHNITGVGYCLNQDNWLPKASETTNKNDKIIEELERLVNKYISYSRNNPVIQDKSNLSYIKPDQYTAEEAFRSMNMLYWDMIERGSRVGNALQIIELREKMFKILTYFAFWRVGDSLDDQKWRSDYEEEVSRLLNSIKRDYDEI